MVKSPNKSTGLGTRGHLKVLKDTKLVLNEHEWHPWSFRINLDHSESLKVPYSPNQFFGRDFFCHFLQQIGSKGQLISKWFVGTWILVGSITLVSMCFSMYCYLYNTQTGCLRLLRELTFNKKEWKIGQVWTCWERFTYPIFYPFAFSRVRIFVHQIEFLVVSQVGYYSSFIYSWSIIPV